MAHRAVAVVGSARQLGALVVDRLIATPDVGRIVAIDTLPPLGASPKLQHADPTLLPLERILHDCQVLVHTAELPAESLDRPLDHVLKSAVAAGVRKIVCVTSVAAYGAIPDHPVPIVEETPRRVPHDGRPHRVAYDIEATLDEVERIYPDLTLVRLRPGLIFGARSTTLPARAFRRGWCPEVSHAAIPVVWDEDIADAVMLAVEREVRGAFNLVVGDTQSLTDLARYERLRVVRIPRSARRALLQGQGSGAQLLCRRCDPHWLAVADTSLYASSRRAREELGWQPSCATSTDVISKYLRRAPRRLNLRITAFFGMIALTRYFPAPSHGWLPQGRIRLVFTGPDGGELGLSFQQGRPHIEWGTTQGPDTVIVMSARLFMEMLAGQVDPVSAHGSGQITTQGDMPPQMALALIQTFRSMAQSNKPWARPARWMAHWIGSGVSTT